MKVLVSGSYREQEHIDYGFPEGKAKEFKEIAYLLGKALAENGDVLVLQWSNNDIPSQLGFKDGKWNNPKGHPYWQTADYHALRGYLHHVGQEPDEADRRKVLIDVAGTSEDFPGLLPFPDPTIFRDMPNIVSKYISPNDKFGPDPFNKADWIDLGEFTQSTVKLFHRRHPGSNALRTKLLKDLVDDVDAVVIIGGGKATELAATTAYQAGKLIPLTAFSTLPTLSKVEAEFGMKLPKLCEQLLSNFEPDPSASDIAKKLPGLLFSLAFVEQGTLPASERRSLAKDPRRMYSLRSLQQAQDMSILLVGTEWSSGMGGLSTVNRELALALADIGQDVRCLLPSFTDDQAKVAGERRVTLLRVAKEETVTTSLSPSWSDQWIPDLIIGHGRVTGVGAQSLKSKFPGSLYAHVVHVVPRDIEILKDDRTDQATERAHERATIERDLARKADIVVAMGPRIERSIKSEILTGIPKVIRLDPGITDLECATVPSGNFSVLLAGRAEDYRLKGLDIAARAMGMVAETYANEVPRLELVVLGAPKGEGDELRQKLRGDARCDRLNIHVIPYQSNAKEVDHRFRQSSLVLMPSRGEGFGLVAQEAIMRGIPCLASDKSGFADLVKEVDGNNEFILPVSEDRDRFVKDWCEAILKVLKDRNEAFTNARALRTMLRARNSWANQARKLVDEAGELEVRPTGTAGAFNSLLGRIGPDR